MINTNEDRATVTARYPDIQSCNPDVSVGGGAGGDSPRPKKKSEIRSLLDATGGTTATADNNKPQWMMFRAQVDRYRYIDT